MKWVFAKQDKDKGLLDNLLARRNISNPQKFLNPSLDDIYDPYLMYGVKDAAKAISEAIKNNKKIFIHGDFDVDGVTATSLLWDFLYRKLNADALPYIPSRFDEGYGLSEESIESIVEQGGDLIITVDCGIKDIELVNKYKNKIDFIISDHHTVREVKNDKDLELSGAKAVSNHLISSDALAVVHPDLNNSCPFTEICGATVSWKLVSALNKFMGIGIDMNQYLDLVALGTVCDVMPLIDENRVITRYGLKQMQQTENVGLRALMKVAGIKMNEVKAYHLGFILGPRINAAGRLDNAIKAVKLLCTNDPNQADKLAQELNRLNSERQDLTQKYLDLAEEQIETVKDNKIYFVYGEDWPEGIVGLIAGRLTEKYNRPTLVGSLSEGIIKASARSIENFNIADALNKSNGFLERFGGHAQAAGFTLTEENKDRFYDFIVELAEDSLSEDDFESTLHIDANLENETLTTNLVYELDGLSPFGYGNPKPTVALLHTQLETYKTVGRNSSHIKFDLRTQEGVKVGCIGFGIANKFLSQIKASGASDFDTSTLPSLDVAGSLDIDRWNGNEKVSFKVKDFRISK